MKKLNYILRNEKVKKAASLTAALFLTCGTIINPSVGAFAAEKENEPLNGFTQDGMYWYENGELQGTEGRGKEIYDKETDAWYWLDAVQGGAVATAKDVYQESWAGAYADNEDGTGKWVRYDKDGHMIKGWDTNEDGTYYFEPITGAMAKGTVEIDGVSYRFDDVTGILLDKVFVTEDGCEYWYEGGIRQGLEGRGKEIYDEASDAWYWLDSVDNGKKATAKDVYQESFAGQFADREDGTGKWVRYDENGAMIKGWNVQNGNTYYFEPITGAMAKGEAEIDGVTYHFDETSGVLLYDVTYWNSIECIDITGFCVTDKGDYININQYIGTETNPIIPAYIMGKPVHLVCIGGNQYVQTITFSDEYTYTGGVRINSCKNLEVVNFGKGMTEIGTQSITYCSNIKEINMYGAVTHIESGWCDSNPLYTPYFSGAVLNIYNNPENVLLGESSIAANWLDAILYKFNSKNGLADDDTEMFKEINFIY